MRDLLTDLLQIDWFVWGIGLILVFQVLVVTLGEFLYRADRRALPIAPILRALRNAVLPLLVIYVFVVKVLGEPAEAISVRILTTALWLSLLYTGLLLLNVLVFEQAPQGTWRHRAPSLFQDLLRMLLIAVGAAIVLAVVWDQDLGGLIAALGVGSIVLGLALQETLGNLMSGIALLFEKPFNIGDWIEVDGDAGEVVEINWRSVQIRTRERNLLIVPNSVLGRAKLVNYARPSPMQTLRLSFGFGLDDPPNRVKQVLTDVALSMSTVLREPAPRALLREVLDDRLRYETFLFIDQPRLIPQIVDEYTTRVWYAARRAGMRLPLPAAHEYQMHGVEPEQPVETVDVAAVLAATQGFEVLEPVEIAQLAERARVLRYGAGETLLAREAVADVVHAIVAGEARIRMRGQFGTAEAVVGPGEVIGIGSLARQEASDVDVVAHDDVTTVGVERRAVEEALRANHRLAQQFAKIQEIRRESMQHAQKALDEGSVEHQDTVLPVVFRKPQSEPDEDDDGDD